MKMNILASMAALMAFLLVAPLALADMYGGSPHQQRFGDYRDRDRGSYQDDTQSTRNTPAFSGFGSGARNAVNALKSHQER